MDEGAAQIHSSSPGARLAAAREQAGMTVLQAAERLRLDVATLQALEAGRFEALGATVFVRGHLRHYAELVGVPVDEIEAAYTASSAKLAAQPDLRRTTTLPGNAPSRGVSLPPRVALIGAIVLVLAALVWWAMRVPPGRRHGAIPAVSSPAPAPASASRAAKAAANPAANPAASPAASSAANSAVDAGPETPAVIAARGDAAASGKAAVPASRDAGSKDAGPKDASPKDAAAAFRDVVMAPRAAATTAADKDSAFSPKLSGRVRLAIRFNQDSWIEVYDAHGATLFHDFGGAGSERRVSGAAPLRVLLGNPDGVSVEIDGHPVALRPAADSGRPQRFLLDSGGHMSDVPATQSQRPASAPSTPPSTPP
jgi:cytoskeleton protein RodZ